MIPTRTVLGNLELLGVGSDFNDDSCIRLRAVDGLLVGLAWAHSDDLAVVLVFDVSSYVI